MTQYGDAYRRIKLGGEFFVGMRLHVHHVHVMDAHLVAVLLVLDIRDVLFLEELAVIVDFVFHVHRAVDIHLLSVVEYGNHVLKSIVTKVHDMLDVAVLFCSKVFLAAELAIDGAGHVVAGIANAFDFRYLAEHRLDGRLAFGAQTAFGHLVQVLGDFDFHVVCECGSQTG